MTNVTYLFGAGASSKSLPLMHDISKRIEKLNSFLIDSNFVNINDDVSKNFRWLYEKCEKYTSIDIYAKILSTRENKESYDKLEKAKDIFSLFFTLEQIRHDIDKRYLIFLSYILNKENNILKISDNINIISWNYDDQFEIALSYFSEINSISTNRNHICTKNFINKNASIFKINGIVGFREIYPTNKEYDMSDEIYGKLDKNIFDKVINYYKNYSENKNNKKLSSSLSFSWEKYNKKFGQENEKDALEISMEKTKNTDILVIIGYSFPFFNRIIDKKIIDNMRSLKKIYYQVPDADKKIDVLKSFVNSSKLEIEPIEYLEQFHIPIEL